MSLLELDIHFLKLNPASFILDLTFCGAQMLQRCCLSPIEVIQVERGQKIGHELGIISFILGHVMSDCCVQQKGRTCNAKYNSVETFHDNVWIYTLSIIYSKKAQNISVSFFDLDPCEGFFNVGRQSNWMVPETH